MREVQVVIYRDGTQWVAQALNIDVSSFGDSPEEAREAIDDALRLYFADGESSDLVHEALEPRLERLVV